MLIYSFTQEILGTCVPGAFYCRLWGNRREWQKAIVLMDTLAGEADNKMLIIKNKIQFQVVISTIKKTKLRGDRYLRL